MTPEEEQLRINHRPNEGSELTFIHLHEQLLQLLLYGRFLAATQVELWDVGVQKCQLKYYDLVLHRYKFSLQTTIISKRIKR